MDEERDNPGVFAPPPLFMIVPVLVGALLDLAIPTSIGPNPLRNLVALLFVVVGLALNVGGYVAQRRAGTSPLPHHPSTRLVKTGVYGFSRNPMYLGMLAWGIGLAILLDTMWGLIFVIPGAVALHYGVIRREERYLEGKFGEEYRAYKREVGRWM